MISLSMVSFSTLNSRISGLNKKLDTLVRLCGVRALAQSIYWTYCGNVSIKRRVCAQVFVGQNRRGRRPKGWVDHPARGMGATPFADSAYSVVYSLKPT